MSKLAERLAKRIYAESGLVVHPEILRSRAGYWQRSTGCWSWSMRVTNKGSGLYLIGSQSPALACAKAKKIQISNSVYADSDYTIDIID